MVFAVRTAAVCAALVSLAGCSTAPPAAPALVPAIAAAAKDPSAQPLNFTTAAGPKAPGGDGPGYVLSDDDKALDCKKLTGRMQIRILDIRGSETRERTTLASRGLHTAGKMVFGGTNAGLNTDAQYAKDKAMLEAFNAQLVAKDCKSFKIPEALAGSGSPSPTVDAPSKAKAKAAAPAKP